MAGEQDRADAGTSRRSGARPDRVLGIDPGLTRCGIGVVDGPPSHPRLVAVDVVGTPAGLAVEERLTFLHDRVRRAIEQYRPDAVAVERVLFSRNVRTAMATGQAAGVSLLAAAQAGIPVESYTPTDVKLSVAGHGGADKEGVGRMVAAQLRLDAVPSPADAADALAIALCHLSRMRIQAAAAATPAGQVLAAAASEARRGARSGWEAVLDRPHIREAGGA